jgi:uncharacterized membrane protein YgcG
MDDVLFSFSAFFFTSFFSMLSCLQLFPNIPQCVYMYHFSTFCLWFIIIIHHTSCKVHVRRGDKLVQRDRFPGLGAATQADAVVSALLKMGVKENSELYLATDEDTPHFFDSLKRKFKLYTLLDMVETDRKFRQFLELPQRHCIQETEFSIGEHGSRHGGGGSGGGGSGGGHHHHSDIGHGSREVRGGGDRRGGERSRTNVPPPLPEGEDPDKPVLCHPLIVLADYSLFINAPNKRIDTYVDTVGITGSLTNLPRKGLQL